MSTPPPTGSAGPPLERPHTDVDRIAEKYFEAFVELSPINATYLGVPGREDELDDLSPAGIAAHSDLRRTAIEELATAIPADDVDRVTIAAMTERLGLAEDRHAAGLDEMSLNVLASPLQAVRDVLDLMPTRTEAHWRTIRSPHVADPARARAVPPVPPRGARARPRRPRQTGDAGAEQSRDLTTDDGYFANARRERANEGRTPRGPGGDRARRGSAGGVSGIRRDG